MCTSESFFLPLETIRVPSEKEATHHLPLEWLGKVRSASAIIVGDALLQLQLQLLGVTLLPSELTEGPKT